LRKVIEIVNLFILCRRDQWSSSLMQRCITKKVSGRLRLFMNSLYKIVLFSALTFISS